MKFRRRRSPDVAIDLTPLIDVVFLLLIFFMVTTSFVGESGLTLELPSSQTETGERPPEPISVEVTAAGTYRLAGEDVAAGREALRQALRDRVGTKRDVGMVIAADANAPHQAVVRVMDVAAGLGLTRVRIATREEEP